MTALHVRSLLTDADYLADTRASLVSAVGLLARLRAILGVERGNLLAAAEAQAAALQTARFALELARQYVKDAGGAVGCEAAVDAVLADALAQINGG
jgi:hypothetical protein